MTKIGARKRRPPFWSSERPWIWLLPIIVLLFVYSVYPFVFNVVISFHRFDPMTKAFRWNFPNNWIDLLTNADFLKSFRTTFIFGGAALLTELVLGIAIALAFDHNQVKLRSLWQSLFILPMVVPPVISGLMFRFLQNADYGIVSNILYALNVIDRTEPLIGGTGRNVLLGLLIVDVWQWTPFVALIVLAGLKAMPHEPIEAAIVDGANRWQLFWEIKLPLLRNVLAVVILFRIVDLLRLFDYVAIMTSGGPGGNSETISHFAYRMHKSIEWGMVSVVGIVVLILAILITNAYMRLFKVRF
ncbi:MAG: carbohydrate ABC transporter permease [Thermoflexales bacterium]